jgi:multidrug efflux pump subunit AcrB
MSAVPFGLVGAVWGHMIMDEPLSRLSFIGMIALLGVVVNDSLVMVDYINRRRREGAGLHEAVLMAGPARFRAILLTSMTTFMGLLPMLLEQSLQAQFLIPLAISLAFGVVFATVVTLFIVPCSYLVLEDFLALFSKAFARLGGRDDSPAGPVPAPEPARSVGARAAGGGASSDRGAGE